jgi:hypothetical protein
LEIPKRLLVVVKFSANTASKNRWNGKKQSLKSANSSLFFRNSDCPVCKSHICESRFLAPSKFFLAALNGLTISCKFEACKKPIVYEFREKENAQIIEIKNQKGKF